MRTKHKLGILLPLLAAFFLTPLSAGAQSVVNMMNNDTLYIDGCATGSGTIYDDGGVAGDYSNNFDGCVVIEASAGLTIHLTGTMSTYGGDDLYIYDGTVPLYGSSGNNSIDVTATSGSMTIRFYTNGSSIRPGFALNWEVSGIGTACTNPVTNLATTAIGTTTVGLSWSATSATGPFTILVDGEQVGTANTTSYTLTGLQPSRRYEVSVVATSSINNRCCGARLAVRTDCDRTVVPFSEGFEDLADGSFPPCWISSVNFDEELYLPQVLASQHSHGTRGLLLSCGDSESPSHFGMVATPTLDASGNYTLRLMLMASHSGLRVNVGYCDSTGTDLNAYNFVPLQTIYVNNTQNWQEYQVNWNTPLPGKRLALRMVQSEQSGIARRLYIDDMQLESCGVTDLEVSHVEYDRMTLSWNEYGSPTCTVGVRREGATADSLIPNAMSPLLIQGLDADTRYTLTIYPTCGTRPSLSRSILACTAPMPTMADGFCSHFNDLNYGTSVPPNWTLTSQGGCNDGGGFGMGYDYYMGEYTAYLSYWNGCGGATAYAVSERLVGLAGKQITVTYRGYNNSAKIEVGTLVHADDYSTFVPLTTSYSDGRYHTVVASVPSNSTGRHIAIRLSNPSWYIDLQITSVSCSKKSVDDVRLLHRRGTTAGFVWGQTYDTVLVQHGPSPLTIGSGVVDTFLHADHGWVEGLTPASDYDFYVYRPGQQLCTDMRIKAHTASRDYPLPYCEDFSTTSNSEWVYSILNYGDWIRLKENNGYPQFGGQGYDGYAGNTLTLSSWGFEYDYYSTAVLPDVAIDSNCYLSFWVNDRAPNSKFIIGTITDDYCLNVGNNILDRFLPLDTLEVYSNNRREHIYYQLRPSDTLFRGRLAIRYYHEYEFSYYLCHIDELQIAHSTYEDVSGTTGFTTATINLSDLFGTDSVEVTLTGGGRTFVDTAYRATMHNIAFDGLDSGTFYLCTVRTLPDGCASYAGYVITHSISGGMGDMYCYNFSNVLSDELPEHWAATDSTLVPPENYLILTDSSALATRPLIGLSSWRFSFRARSKQQGDTLVLASMPADSIHEDSTHFVLNPAWLTRLDTFVIDTTWKSYMMRLPNWGTDTVRLCFLTGADSTSLDDIGFSSCPIVHFTVEGNNIVCTLDEDQGTAYYLTLTDTNGDSRTILVESNPYRVEGLRLGMRYEMDWRCLYASDGTCHPRVVVKTDDYVRLPYCEDFNVGMGSVKVPATWTFIKGTPSDDVRLDTWGPSLQIYPYSSIKPVYAVLPQFIVDSGLSLRGYIYSWYDDGVQIGVMDNETDTSSFVPLWSSKGNRSQYPEVDFTGYTDKRVAIRVNRDVRIFNLHVYPFPLYKVSLIDRHTLEVTTPNEHPYWLHHRRDHWEHYLDTMMYVDTNRLVINEPYDNNHVYLTQGADSTGYTCDDEHQYFLSVRYNLPACWEQIAGLPYGCFTYSPYDQNGVSTWNYRPDLDFHTVRFYNNYSQWVVMPDFEIDSIKRASMKVTYDAASVKDTLVVGVCYDAYDTNTFVPVDTLVYTREDGELQDAIVYFTSYAGKGRWITFHYLRHNTNQWIDLVSANIESCPAAMGATASLSRWNQVKIDGPLTPFYVEYYQNGTSWQGNSDNTIMRVDSVPQILILQPETEYLFYFRCDSSATTCVPPQQVTTLAAPLDVPTCVDFDTVVLTTVPHNWTSHHVGVGTTDQQAHSGNKSMKLPVATTSYLVTPDINIDSLKHVAISLWYRVEDLSDRLVVGVMSDPTDLSTFYPIRSLAPSAVGTWERQLVEFGIAPEEAHFIAFRARSNRPAGERSVLLDDVYFTSCAAFDFRVQSLTNNTINLTWNQVGNPDVTITVLDNDSVTGVYNNATPPLEIYPLTTLHYYSFQFASDCGDPSATDYCNTNYRDTVSVVTPAPGVGCVNPTDLASPQAVFFSGTYANPYSRAGAINYGSFNPDSRHTVCYDTAQRDPRTGNQLRTIPEGYTSSVRLGNWSTNAYNPEAEGVMYSLYVDTASFELLLLRYAAVLQDPLHDPADQPRFRMELLDTSFNIIDSACTSADFIADQSLGWNTAADGVLWKDWTAVGVDLTAHAGEQVIFRLTTYDCNEGSHYGYAYFTLECMRKNMNTESCGAIDSNTLKAPEGFHYRWYTDQSPTTISTAQSITVPTEDVTYFCDISKLDNPNCRFTISAYGGTRYPKADFATTISIDSCRFHVTFLNLSGVSKDGTTLIPGDRCESAFWDYGNGTASGNYHGYAVYDHPGSYRVQLVSGIANDECQDTVIKKLVLELPPGMAPSDTTEASICDNQQYTFFDSIYTEQDTFYHMVPVPGQVCDSMYVLLLEVRATTMGDTVAVVCDSITWHDTTYRTDGVYVSHVLGLNTVGCDTTCRLTLTVHPTYDTVDTLVFCPYRPYVYRGVDYGGPVQFDTVLMTMDNCDSTVHVNLTPRDSTYHLVNYYGFDTLPLQATDTLIIGCAPVEVILTDSTVGADQWSWQLFLPDTLLTSTTRSIEHTFYAGADSVVAWASLVVLSNEGCLDTAGWPLLLFPTPKPDFRWNPILPSINHAQVLFENLSEPLPCTMDSVHGSVFLWRIQKEEGGAFDTTSLYAPAYRWGDPADNMAGDYTIRLIEGWIHHSDTFRASDMPWVDASLFPLLLYPAQTHTCVDSIEQVLTITNEFLQFPNLVTPNGDGINDRWEVANLLEFGNYSMNELWIYDRTGALVYHVKNIRRAEQFWDPAATRSPDGTYYYRFVAEGDYGVVKRNGLIEVVK